MRCPTKVRLMCFYVKVFEALADHLQTRKTMLSIIRTLWQRLKVKMLDCFFSFVHCSYLLMIGLFSLFYFFIGIFIYLISLFIYLLMNLFYLFTFEFNHSPIFPLCTHLFIMVLLYSRSIRLFASITSA